MPEESLEFRDSQGSNRSLQKPGYLALNKQEYPDQSMYKAQV
jgi:hypothetical protein